MLILHPAHPQAYHCMYNYGQVVKLVGTHIDADQQVSWIWPALSVPVSRTVTQIGDDYYVTVPDDALKQEYDFTGRYVYVDADSGTTVYTINATVILGADINGEPSEDNVTYIGSLVARAEGYRDEAAAAVIAAEGHADTAGEQADLAESEADRAEGSEADGAVGVHNVAANAHTDIRQAVQTAESIARGKATAHVFDTYTDMVAWLADPDNVAALVVGDNLYIRDIGVKDYWWDGEAAQILEAEAPDLTDYYTKIPGRRHDAHHPVPIRLNAPSSRREQGEGL